MRGRKIKAGMVILLFLSLGITSCGVSRQQYVKDFQLVRKDVKDLRQQLEAQKGILDSHGKALAENRLSIKDNTAALVSMRADVRATKEIVDKVLVKAKKPERVAVAPPKKTTPLGPGSLARVRSQIRGRPLYFAGGFNRPGDRRYILRLLPGTMMRVLDERTDKFTRARILSPQKIAGKVVWVRTRWLEPVE